MRSRHTVIGWLEYLPERYRYKALFNARQCLWYKHSLKRRVSSLAIAIQCAFDFEDTPEGTDYWMIIYNELVEDAHEMIHIDEPRAHKEQ